MDVNSLSESKILGWLTGNTLSAPQDADSDHRLCYLCPQYVLSPDGLVKIDRHNQLTETGRIAVRISGAESVEDVILRLGHLVVFRLIEPGKLISSPQQPLRYNSSYGQDASEIWLERMDETLLVEIQKSSHDINTVLEQMELDLTYGSEEICTRYLLLQYGNSLYGPFEHSLTQSCHYQLSPLKHYDFTAGRYYLADCEQAIITITDHHGQIMLTALQAKALVDPRKCTTHFDKIPQDCLLQLFLDQARSHLAIKRTDLNQIREYLQSLLLNEHQHVFTPERLNRLHQLFPDMLKIRPSIGTELCQLLLNNQECRQQLINDIATTSGTELFYQLSDPARDAFFHDISTQFDINYSQLLQQLKQQKALIKQQQQQLGQLKEQLAPDQQQSVSAHAAPSDQKQEHSAHQIPGSDTTKERRSSSAPYFDINFLIPAANMNRPISIINKVVSYISMQGGRSCTYNDIANYLICITQGFITTFAGEPGTGKTSLCTLLARALGLVPDQEHSRFTEVAVERGWTSLKDMIGYYNPLTHSLEQSNAEVFQAFARMDQEARHSYDGGPYNRALIAPYLILLDEANLSPIEHYWAAFFKNCDFNLMSPRTITLGGNNTWQLPEHLRFLATVNFDHTTEELSPRFLDRSWIITLDPVSLSSDANSEAETEPEASSELKTAEKELLHPETDNQMIPFECLWQAFTPHPEDKLSPALLQKWKRLQAIFKSEECALPIRPRNLKMVQDYCLTAGRCMGEDNESLIALDYAFAQKILPGINGSGARYTCLIKQLLQECTKEEMPLSWHHLKRIERNSGELGFYQFFTR